MIFLNFAYIFYKCCLLCIGNVNNCFFWTKVKSTFPWLNLIPGLNSFVITVRRRSVILYWLANCKICHILITLFFYFSLISHWYAYHRLSVLSELYGGYLAAYTVGIEQVRRLFPKTGLSSPKDHRDDLEIPEHYPGRLDLYDFVTKSAHTTEDMIELWVYLSHKVPMRTTVLG